jgi:hypothetical protein
VARANRELIRPVSLSKVEAFDELVSQFKALDGT